ncbi:hypothetical protein [Streptomyces xanthophaeus]|uniref:Uncharacterized protein n=1 Tax=Streptomyces xanthophaeus TaxID=67385 RepID=A0A919LG78_9ACTN|nr:hypothetical protein [Streptomyces xanthophaeus]GHI90440.1 hypothetical protein Sxan_78040 [Streptomyces xanthophaeus]
MRPPEAVFLGGRRGSQRVYPPGTLLQVLCLAAVCDQLQPRMPPEDLILLAFFAEMPLPSLPGRPLRVALARAYFGARFQRQAEEQRAYEGVPGEWRDEVQADYNWAETEAELEVRRTSLTSARCARTSHGSRTSPEPVGRSSTAGSSASSPRSTVPACPSRTPSSWRT